MVSDRSENVATPLDAVAVSVPPSVAPPGLFASATVTVPLNEVSMLPELSSASTVRPKGVPAARLAGGCCVTTSCPVTGGIAQEPECLDAHSRRIERC